MKLNSEFELINLADEYMAIPIGEKTTSFKGIVMLSEASFFLLNELKSQRTIDELIVLLAKEYDVDEQKAKGDIDDFIQKMIEFGVIS